MFSKNIYFNINTIIFFRILFSGKDNFFFLNKESLLINILKILKKKITLINFQINHLQINNKSIFFYTDTLVNNFTQKILENVKKNKELNKCNKRFYNNEINLFTARYIQLNLEKKVLKLELVKKYVKGKKNIFLDFEDEYVKKFIEKKYKVKIIHNYSFQKFLISINYIKSLLQFLFISLFSNFCNFFIKRYKKDKKILINLEGSFNLDSSFRNDVFFLNKNQKKLILGAKNSYSIDYKNSLRKNNIINLDRNFFIYNFSSKINNEIDKDFFELKNSYILKKDFYGLFNHFKKNIFSLKKISTFFNSHNISFTVSAISNWNTINIEILRKFYHHKTISYQYSFLQIVNPVMSYCSNYMLIFSNYFKKIFSNCYAKPKKFYLSGYPYSYQKKFLKPFIQSLEKKYSLKNKFIITYFDENMGNEWNIHTINEIESKYEKLAKFVLSNKDIVVLIKTQFIKNNPTKIFQHNELIYRAIQEKKFIELSLESKYGIKNHSGSRNIILPMTSSLLSHISISQKYGVTTALESGMVNKRCILINDKNFSSKLDYYLKKNIEFKNLDKALNRILILKKNIHNKKNDDLGNWQKIISKNLKIPKNEYLFFNIINKILKRKVS